jgi:hypothetical protein
VVERDVGAGCGGVPGGDLELVRVRVATIGGLLPEDLPLEIQQLDIVVLVEHVMDRGQREVLVGASVARNVVVAHRLEQQLVGHRPGGRIGCWIGLDRIVGKVDEIKQCLVGAVVVMDHQPVGVECGSEIYSGDMAVQRHQVSRGNVRGIEMQIHVEQDRVAGVGGLYADGRVDVDHVPLRVPCAIVVDVVPGQCVPSGGLDVRPQFVQSRQGLVGQSPIRQMPGRIVGKGVPIEKPRARDVVAGIVGVFHPLAQQQRHLVFRAVGLALVDKRRSVVGVLRHCIARVVRDRSGDRQLVHRLPIRPDRAVQRIVRRQRHGDLGGIGSRFANEVEAVIEELAEDHEPHAVARITCHRIDAADEGPRIADALAGVALRLQCCLECGVGVAIGRIVVDKTRIYHGLADHARGVVDHVTLRIGVFDRIIERVERIAVEGLVIGVSGIVGILMHIVIVVRLRHLSHESPLGHAERFPALRQVVVGA